MKRPWLLPLVPLYAAALAVKNGSLFAKARSTDRLGDPVISVGSLSAGGAGKTPVVIALAEALRRGGYGVDILSRGYGRTATQEVKRVLPEGTAEEFGDEPLLMARTLGLPVYVAARRADAGRMAERDRRVRRDNRNLSLHLLDDGFQHRQLPRAMDVVLLTAEDAQDTLLPAGNLREPLHALRRAGIILLRSDEAGNLRPVVQRLFPDGTMPPLWIAHRRFAVVEGTASKRPLAFCGIARPGGFVQTLTELGIDPVASTALRDHVTYNAEVVRKLIGKAQQAGADGFVTTAKDAVKLTAANRQALASLGSLAVCDVQVRLEDERRCVEDLLRLVEANWKRRLQP